MNPELLAALAAANTTPWAMHRPTLEAARRAMAGNIGGLGAMSRQQLMIGRDLAEPVSMSMTRDAVEVEPTTDANGDRWRSYAAAPPSAAIAPATERATARRSGSVVVVPVKGVISNRVSILDWLFGVTTTPPAWIARQVRAAVDDESVKAVILDIDSPGGVVTDVPEAADAIYAARGKKPIIAQVTGTCASAAYWIGVGADEMVASRSALVGSVGVYLLHESWAKFWEEVGVQATYIATADPKVEGNEYEALSPDAEAHMREMVGDYMAMFVQAVARGRGVAESVARGEQFGQGRVYVADRAKSRGMVDKVRDLTATLGAYGVRPEDMEPDARKGRARALLERELACMEMDA